jgi:hypothetical protein
MIIGIQIIQKVVLRARLLGVKRLETAWLCTAEKKIMMVVIGVIMGCTHLQIADSFGPETSLA